MTLNSADPAFEAHLRAILPAAAFGVDAAPFLNEPRGRWQGQGIVVAPGSVKEVSDVMAACHAAQVPWCLILAALGWSAGKSCKTGRCRWFCRCPAWRRCARFMQMKT